MAYIDYGQGIWQREKEWYWLTCGYIDTEKKIGLNIGSKWSDKTGINENCVKVNGSVIVEGESIEFNDVLSWCEDHYARW